MRFFVTDGTSADYEDINISVANIFKKFTLRGRIVSSTSRLACSNCTINIMIQEIGKYNLTTTNSTGYFNLSIHSAGFLPGNYTLGITITKDSKAYSMTRRIELK